MPVRPKRGTVLLTDTDSRAVAAAVDALSDIQLTLNSDNAVVSVNVSNAELQDLNQLPWQGQLWTQFIGDAHRASAERALAKARQTPGSPVRLDIEHPWSGFEQTLPISYRLIADAASDTIYALGIDLRAVANLRQQLANAQQAMEHDYWSMRHIENRYRRLFQMASDGFMVIDDVSTRILEANPRATALLSPDERSIVGRPFPLGLIADGAEQITDAMVESRAAGTSSVTLTVGDHRCRFEVNYLRQDQESRLLIKVTALSEPKGAQEAEANSGLLQAAPDAVVVVDERGILLDCNRTFLEWTQTPNEEQIRGRHADQWIGRTNVDASVLMSNLRQYGAVRLYASVLRCRFGSLMDVEISAVKLPGSAANYALFIRDVARRVTADHPMSQQLPSSIEQITRRVGQVPLKELVRESTDVIEALCIEAALELTRDNRASAAELLGLSRQSLYTKLRRYGIGDNGEDE